MLMTRWLHAGMGKPEAEVTAKASVVPSRREQRKQEAVKLMPPPPSLAPPARPAGPPPPQPKASTSGYNPPPWTGQPPPGVSLQVLKDGVPVQDIPLQLPATVFGRSATSFRFVLCCILYISLHGPYPTTQSLPPPPPPGACPLPFPTPTNQFAPFPTATPESVHLGIRTPSLDRPAPTWRLPASPEGWRPCPGHSPPAPYYCLRQVCPLILLY